MKLIGTDVKAIYNIDWEIDFHGMKQKLITTPILIGYKQWKAYMVYIGISRVGLEYALMENDVVTTCAT